MNQTNKQALIGLKKAKTSLENTIKMIEDEKYCIDVIQQTLAVIGLLKSANLKLLENHLWTCFVTAAKQNDQDKMDDMIDELLKIVKTAQNK